MKLFFNILFILVFFATDLYSLYGFRTSIFKVNPTLFTILYSLTTVLTLAGISVLIVGFSKGYDNVTFLINLSIGIAFSFIIAKLFTSSLFLAEDITRGFWWTAKSVASFENANGLTRSLNWGIITFVLGSVFVLAINYGVIFGKYQFTVHRKTLEFNSLPKAFDGFKIAQLSDMHLGNFDNKEKVKRGLDKLQAENPDIIVFTGDMVNNKASEAIPFIKMIKNLSAPHGKYTILGNHDYGDYVEWSSKRAMIENRKQLDSIGKEMGLTWLYNKHIPIIKGDDSIYVAGVENWGVPPFPQYGNIDTATKGLSNDDFIMLLSHDPTHWKEKVIHHPKNIGLTMSGHTHGMQFGIEIGNFRWSPVKLKYKDWADVFEHAGKYLYINRGFGCLAFPGRLGIWPEITIITLKSSN